MAATLRLNVVVRHAPVFRMIQLDAPCTASLLTSRPMLSIGYAR